MPVASSLHTALRADLTLASEASTRAMAEGLAPLLGPGDTLLLEGPIGAGKTAFARALILALLARAGAPAEDVPSPTFTLVQTYVAGDLEIWHADLYRLTHPDEAAELGLEDAFETALCLVEWPDRLGERAPAGALHLHFEPGTGETERHLTLSGPASWRGRLAPVLDRVDG